MRVGLCVIGPELHLRVGQWGRSYGGAPGGFENDEWVSLCKEYDVQQFAFKVLNTCTPSPVCPSKRCFTSIHYLHVPKSLAQWRHAVGHYYHLT